jgi:hypothetical protein
MRRTMRLESSLEELTRILAGSSTFHSCGCSVVNSLGTAAMRVYSSVGRRHIKNIVGDFPVNIALEEGRPTGTEPCMTWKFIQPTTYITGVNKKLNAGQRFEVFRGP